MTCACHSVDVHLSANSFIRFFLFSFSLFSFLLLSRFSFFLRCLFTLDTQRTTPSTNKLHIVVTKANSQVSTSAPRTAPWAVSFQWFRVDSSTLVVVSTHCGTSVRQLHPRRSIEPTRSAPVIVESL